MTQKDSVGARVAAGRIFISSAKYPWPRKAVTDTWKALDKASPSLRATDRRLSPADGWDV